MSLSIHAGESLDRHRRPRHGVLLLKRTNDREKDQVFRFRKLQVTRVYADNARISRTPATVSAEVNGLKVILPR